MTVYRRPDPIPRRPQAIAAEQHALQVRAEQANLSHLVARRIFQAILDGRFPPGSILPNETDLSRELGVSRTALREAINGLAAKGMLEARRRRGTKVLESQHWTMLDADVIAWMRRGDDARMSAELWEALSTALDAVVALAARQRRPTRLPESAPDALLHIARLGGNRFLYSLIATCLRSLSRDDPWFLTEVLGGLTPERLRRLEGHLWDGDTEAARRLLAETLHAQPVS